jgi:two-component system response regulator YesN
MLSCSRVRGRSKKRRGVTAVYRVVIAEDEMLVRLGLRNAIHWDRFGMEVIADVPNGQEALEVYKREKPDIIITDLRMPVMGGIELIEQIRQNDPDTKIIILTCVEEFETVRQAIHHGVYEYILKLTMKPTEMEEVLERVASELRRNTKRLPTTPSVDENLLIERLFKDFMFRQLYTAEELREILHKMDRSIQERALLVLVMEIGCFRNLQERLKDDKGDLAAFSLLNVLGELFKSYGKGALFHDERNRFIAILSFGEIVSEQKREQMLRELTQSIRYTLKTLYGVPLFFSASTVKNGFHMLSSLYREAMKGLDTVFFTGSDVLSRPVVVDNQSVDSGIGACFTMVSEKLRGLERCGDAFSNTTFRQQLRSKVDAYLQSLQHEPADRKRTLQFMAQLIQLPIVYFRLRNEEATGRIELHYHERLEASDTLDDAIDVFSAYMLEFASLYEAQRSFTNKEVSSAVQYIRRHYQRDLSLKEIADEIGMSPNYFSTLFAKETGHGVIDYIHLLRVEKAKRLLIESRLKSYEIAAQVGFTDHSYFSKVFKKMTGFNPREYRLQHYEEGFFNDDNKQNQS